MEDSLNQRLIERERERVERMSSKEYDDDDEMELDDVDEELTQEDTWSVVSAFFDEFQMVSATTSHSLIILSFFFIYIQKNYILVFTSLILYKYIS